jgi:hypothetical protein
MHTYIYICIYIYVCIYMYTGAFVEAFKSLFEIYSGGQSLVIQTCGKPFKIQYDFARYTDRSIHICIHM